MKYLIKETYKELAHMKNLVKYSLVLLITVFLVSCNNLMDGINEDPNNPTTAPYQNVLTGAEVGNIILQTGENARLSGIFAGYYTGIQRQHEGFNSYTLTTSDFDALWESAYVKTLRNAKVTEELATADGSTGVVTGITQVIEAQALGIAAALYGDIPFDDAADIAIDNPHFIAQFEAYNKLQILLDEAIINLESGIGRPPSGADIYFDGDPTAWIEVAHTLKARFYMQTKEYASAFLEAGIGISSMANSMYAPHGTGVDEANLTYQFFAVQVRGADVVTSDFMTSLVASDPAANPDFTNYRGNAKTDETARYKFYFLVNSVGTQPNTVDGFAAIDASAPMVTYQENLLILAESGYRSVDFAAGLTHLNEFRTFMSSGGYLVGADPAEILYSPYVSADFDNGGIENPDNINSGDALLREILEERYVTLFGQIEGFNDTRRTYSESAVRVPIPPNTGTELPQRFLYPQSEIDRNSNTPDPIPGLFEKTTVNQ